MILLQFIFRQPFSKFAYGIFSFYYKCFMEVEKHKSIMSSLAW